MPTPYFPPIAAPRLCYPVQFLLYANGVTSNGGSAVPQLYGPSTQGFTWPMTIPASRWFVLTNAHFGAKYGALGRSSYFCINAVMTLTDVTQTWTCGHPSQGILLPPGFELGGAFINNEFVNENGPINNEPMNMTAMVRGFMVDHQPCMNWFTVLHGINFDSFAHPGEVMTG